MGHGHRHHSYSHPEAYGHVVVETPVTSDIDEDFFAPRRSRHTSHSRSQHRQAYSSQSHSRSRQPSREYLKGGYVYTSDRDPVVIDPYVPIATTVEPSATYIRPSESHLHAFHSVPGTHYHSPTPQPTEDDLRSRFLHRSCSPISRAPLGTIPNPGKSRSRVYTENEYETPLADQYYADDDVLAAQEEERRRERDDDKRRRRRREKEKEERKEHAYIHAHAPGAYRKSTGAYYP